MANPGFLSKRVKKTPQSGITSDRYEFLSLNQAEPDLGDPLVGPSSVGAKPVGISSLYFLASTGDGSRYWTSKANIIAGGVVQPGAVTVYQTIAGVGTVLRGNQNSVFEFNFIGSGVTVTGVGTNRVNVDITASDLSVTGNTGVVPFKASTGFLQGASDLIYSNSNKFVGIGSTTPTSKLDVIGDVKISGIITSASATITRLTIPTTGSIGVGTTNPIANLDVRGTVNISGVTTIATLVATSSSLTNLSAGIATINSISATTANLGVTTVTTLTTGNSIFNGTGFFTGNVGIGSTIPQRRLDIAGNASTDQSQVAIRLLNTNTTGFGAFIGLNAASIGRDYRIVSTGVSEGIGTGRFSIFDNTANSHRFVIGSTGNVGIATTNPQYNLDINGTVGINSIVYLGGASGNTGELFTSQGPLSPARWSPVSGVTVGAASSVTITNLQNNLTYYPTFTEQSISGANGSIRVDTEGLVFNPSTNTLGIGTTNVTSGINTSFNIVARTSNITGFATFSAIQVSGAATFTNNLQVNGSTLFVSFTSDRVGIGTTNPTARLDVRGDVSIANTITIGSQNLLATGIFTSTSTSIQTIDSFSSSNIRSARYNVQVTAVGQLVSSASTTQSPSVTSLGGGINYVSGNYTNVALNTLTGTGNDAYANLTINPENTLTLSAITADASFISNEIPTSALRVSQPIIFSKAIPASATQNSKVTSIRLLNSGSGYTSVPTIGIATPMGVAGFGSTAIASVASLMVTDVTINTPGVHTTIPTVQFKTPVGIGGSATGIVGFGVSSIGVVSSGSRYTLIPTISIVGSATSTASAQVSNILVSNIDIQNTGTGYTGSSGGNNYPVITINPPTSGTGITATATVSSLGISTYFNITPGVGYTTPPLLTVSSPNIGVNTATIQSSLGISTFIITNPGAGYTSSPLIIVSPQPPTNFDYIVGLGVTSTGTGISSGGVGYNTTTVFYDCAGVGGIGTGARLQLQFTGSPTASLTSVTVNRQGFGYTVAPIVNLSGQFGNNGINTAATVNLGLCVTDVKILNTGFGLLSEPIATVGIRVGQTLPTTTATLSPSLGIGTVTVNNHGSGYTTVPTINVTSTVGTGATVTTGLGVTSSNITITNAGTGYTSIPRVVISSPVGVGTSASGTIGIGISQIRVVSTGFGYTETLPTVQFTDSAGFGSGVTAGISSIIVTNVSITNPGFGYTAADLAITPIATYIPTGTASTVGFGVSTIDIISTGIGYTTSESAVISFTPKPSISTGTTAVASVSLGYPGILPGPGYGITTQIYYIQSITGSNNIKLCTGILGGVGIGTITSADVAEGSVAGGNFTDVTYFTGGSVSNVNIVSPGSGYTATSRLTATNFDGGNVGIGFSFITGTVVNNYQISDIMVLNNVGAFSTVPDFIEYGTLANNEILGTFNADLSGSNVRLLFTPTYRNNVIRLNDNYTLI